VIVTPEELAALREHARAEYPRESCGVILARGQERQVLRCRNIQDELHARDPERHPRDARTAYYIDPRDLLRVGRLESEGFAVAVIYHSHVDVGAYFSETDRRQALMEGEPSYPKTVYLVTSVRGTAAGPQVEATAAFAWDQVARDFAPVELQPTVSQNGEGND
jgi:adenylyltransferase/sulfurtransferase